MSHALTLIDDGDGWDVAECSCGWKSPPSPDTEVAAGFWGDHRLLMFLEEHLAPIREQLGLLSSAVHRFLEVDLQNWSGWTGSNIGADAVRRLVDSFDHAALNAADALIVGDTELPQVSDG